MKYSYIEHYDIDDFKQQLSFEVDAYQVSGGKLKTWRHVFNFPHITLFCRHENAAINLVCKNNDDQFMLGLPKVRMWVNGQSLDANKLFVVAPSEVLYTPMPEQFNAHGISFNYSEAEKFLKPGVLQALKTHANDIRTGKVNLPYLAEFQLLMKEWVEYLIEHHPVLTDVQCAEFEARVFAKLEKLFQPLLLPVGKAKQEQSPRKNIIDRAMRYLAENKQNTITIPELAEQCFCSTRSLEYAFKKFYQMSPKQFLNLRRLHLMRRDIKKQKFDSLKALSLHYGITNAGRVSAQYRKLFGEYPKETWGRFS